ncbi:MAG TPA: hypothetical protein VH682_30070 [Gemmataceae bacterium]
MNVLLLGILFAAPILPGTDHWPTVFRGQWEVEHPKRGKYRIILEKNGVITLRRYETDRNGKDQLITYRGNWRVHPWTSAPGAKLFRFWVETTDGTPLTGFWVVEAITSRDEILLWDKSRLTLKRMK